MHHHRCAAAAAAAALLVALSAVAPGVHAHGGFVGVGVDLPLVSVSVGAAAAAAANCPQGGERFVAYLSGLNNVAPNSTAPLPALSPVKGRAAVCVDAGARRGTWALTLCNFGVLTGGYLQSHVHVGGPSADFPPPLLPLEPAGKPSDPLAPPQALPSLRPPLVFYGCRDSQGAFTEADLVALPPSPLPTVGAPITTLGQFAAKARAGELYVNAHSARLPAGEARGNLRPA